MKKLQETFQTLMTNREKFQMFLAEEYSRRFKSDPDYAFSAYRTMPEDLAEKMTLAFARGNGDKDGKAIKATCKFLGIPYTYKAISTFLND